MNLKRKMQTVISSVVMLMLVFSTMVAAEDAKESKEAEPKEDAQEKKETSDKLVLTITTTKGDIHLNLFAEEAPVTVASFVNLIQHGYYDGLNFHRVIANFMIQGGCPEGTGSGGPGYKFEDEFKSDKKHDRPGILSMANSGPGTNGSQFFITHVPTPHLNGKHTVFGAVVADEDLKVVNSIAKGDKIVKMTITGDTASLLKAQADRVAAWDKVIKVAKK